MVRTRSRGNRLPAVYVPPSKIQRLNLSGAYQSHEKIGEKSFDTRKAPTESWRRVIAVARYL